MPGETWQGPKGPKALSSVHTLVTGFNVNSWMFVQPTQDVMQNKRDRRERGGEYQGILGWGGASAPRSFPTGAQTLLLPVLEGPSQASEGPRMGGRRRGATYPNPLFSVRSGKAGEPL